MLSPWHHQDITVEPLLSVSQGGWRGEETYGSAIPMKARIEYTQSRVTNPEGREMLSRGRCIVQGIQTGFNTRARLTLPEPFTPTNPPILSVEINPDPLGVASNTVIWF